MPDVVRSRLLFLTGKLAEPSLCRLLDDLAAKVGFDFEVIVMPITVAALMTTEWIARRLVMPANIDKLILPGFVRGHLDELAKIANVPVELGPKDLRDLPEFFGKRREAVVGYGAYNIEILAEINHAPQLSLDQILTIARHHRSNNADVIDLGCDPGGTWDGIGDAVRLLKAEGFRVSVDSFNPMMARVCVPMASRAAIRPRSLVSGGAAGGVPVVLPREDSCKALATAVRAGSVGAPVTF